MRSIAARTAAAVLLLPSSAAAQSVSFEPQQRYPTGQPNPVAIVGGNFLDVLPNDDIAVAPALAEPGQPFYLSSFSTTSKGTLGPPGLFPRAPATRPRSRPGISPTPGTKGSAWRLRTATPAR